MTTIILYIPLSSSTFLDLLDNLSLRKLNIIYMKKPFQNLL